jgi:hypothetical protein
LDEEDIATPETLAGGPAERGNYRNHRGLLKL